MFLFKEDAILLGWSKSNNFNDWFYFTILDFMIFAVDCGVDNDACICDLNNKTF